MPGKDAKHAPCACGGSFTPPTDLGTHSIYGSKPHSGIARITLHCSRRCGRTKTIEIR